jgi:hypothetical protein
MKTKFNPLVFLASLGAGGVAVMPFVLMQYTIEHGAGLITRAQLWSNSFNVLTSVGYFLLEAIMIVFSLLHVVLTIVFAISFFRWIKTSDFKELMQDPLRNASILAPLISILMTMNLFIGPIRYFLPLMSGNFQSLFLPAMIFWVLLFLLIMFTEIKLLSIAFINGFDMEKIHFGWLLHPFLLGMLSTVGTGIAAMSKDSLIANSAAFLSLISLSMGLFLFLVKIVILFKSHFGKKGLPENQFLASFLIVIPIITLFAISFFRLGHFLEIHHGFHLDSYFYLIIGMSFAFEIWYFIFGLVLLYNYFKKNHFNEFYVTQWGFICPFVAFVVLGAFAYEALIKSWLLYLILLLMLLITILLFFEIFYKQISCSRGEGLQSKCLD